ncbi:Integrator complex subunit 3 [Coemansia spiralis]|uniref:Integrator complex subunit 3 n=1 Tax=Coemansia spiralis TaxID=417178 RepID=A0A9W8GKC2_9FUNG|nr:Integrator complex subunit 3 [Coemansia spiralis]
MSELDPLSSTPKPPQLFASDPIDVIDAWQQELCDNYHLVAALISGKPPTEAHDVLQQRASESMKSHGELINGLLYGLLTESSEPFFRQLSLVARDGYAHAINRLLLVAGSPKFVGVRQKVRVQLLWTVAALVRANAAGVDALVLALVRQMRGGDVTMANFWLVSQMLGLLEANYAWLVGHSTVVAMCAYAFARLALDMGTRAAPAGLRDRCSEFAVRLIRERFADCAVVGRDLVRVLQAVAKIPVFRDLWSDLLYHPQVISPVFAGVDMLLRVPTPRVFLANRITAAMEGRLLFMLEQVPVGGYSRNLTWFVHRFLSTPESDTLYPDIIRYVCGVFHPSNSVLASNIVPRYVFLGSLLLYVRSQVTAANAKLALFYDWMFYDPMVDNIMNVEPGVLIMARSVDRYPFLTASFIEYLAFVADAFFPLMAPDVRQSISLVMRQAVEKGVIHSLLPIYEQPKLGKATRRYMQTLFPMLVPQRESEAGGRAETNGGPESESEEDELAAGNPGLSEPLPPPPVVVDDLPVAVDDLPAVDLDSLDPVSRMFHEESPPPVVEYDSEDDEEEEVADEPLLVEDDSGEAWSYSSESLLEDPSLWVFGSMLSDYVENGSSVSEIISVFAQSEASTLAVARILASVALAEDVELEDVETNAELQRMGESDIEHDVLHAILLAAFANEGPRALELLVQLTRARVDVGFRWLLLCIERSTPPFYARYVERFSSGSVAGALARDLGVLQERFTALFYEVLPLVYAAFPNDLPGSSRVVRSVVALIDQSQVYRLNSLISRGLLRLFGQRAARVVSDMMECDAFEQVCLWQLLAAEISGDSRMVGRVCRSVLLGGLDPQENSEAANGLLAVLRTVRPCARLVSVLSTYFQGAGEQRADLCGSVLTAWIQSDRDALKAALAVLGSEERAALVGMWTERFASRRFAELSIAEMLVDCEKSPEVFADLFTPTLESLAVDEPPPLELPPVEVKPKVEPRKRNGGRQFGLVKRRRRNVITSDDEEEEELSSSPVLSSSSLESDSD